jgi:hypothetical protein
MGGGDGRDLCVSMLCLLTICTVLVFASVFRTKGHRLKIEPRRCEY